MTERLNHLGQPIGVDLDGWTPPPFPEPQLLEGQYCRLEPLQLAVHARALFEAFHEDDEGRNWTYLSYGPFVNLAEFETWLQEACMKRDPSFYAIVDKVSEKPVGLVSLLRINPEAGSVEVGHINYSPLLQKQIAATEAMFLLMSYVFRLGYRRYEWKCDALNAASRSAAQRLGFSFEGIFRQALHYKGRNRDTAWYAMIDREWPALQEAFRRWLDPTNFDQQGKQRVALRLLTGPIINH